MAGDDMSNSHTIDGGAEHSEVGPGENASPAAADSPLAGEAGIR